MCGCVCCAQVTNLLSATCALVDHKLALRRAHAAAHAAATTVGGSPGALLLLPLTFPPVKVVEFCGGAGYVALPLAALYAAQDVEVVLLDMKVGAHAILLNRTVYRPPDPNRCFSWHAGAKPGDCAPPRGRCGID
jgi:predicted O-methyltransferase YrrM